MVEAVAAAVRDCMVQTGITDPKAVHYVQVKGPLLTPARISDARARGAELATEDPNGSKAFARGAMALGRGARTRRSCGRGPVRSGHCPEAGSLTPRLPPLRRAAN